MRKIIFGIFIIIIGAVFASQTYAGYFSELEYSTGISAGYQHIDYQPGYGADFSPNNTMDYELFYTGQSRHMFGFEFGLSLSPTASKYTTLYAGDLYPGTTVALGSGAWELYLTEFNTQTIYLGINKYYGLDQRNKFRIFGMAGLAFAAVESTINFVDDEGPGVPSDANISERKRTFMDAKFIPVIKLGFEYDLNKDFGLRIAYSWKNYAAFNSIKSDEKPYSKAELRFKNANAIYFSIYATL